MSSCARCGQGICTTAGKIALNKVWHKGCFCCYNCNRPLRVNNAKIYYGEVFCSCCCPQIQEVYPLKVCKVKSTPSFSPDCCQKIMKPVACCSNSSDDCCRVRDAHSCGCIPACCNPKYSPCSCQECEEPCFKRIHSRPKSPKPINYPPRQQNPRCSCCSKPPKIKNCPPDRCYPVVKKKQPYLQCYEGGKKASGYEGKKKLIYFQPSDNNGRNNCCKCTAIDRCRRCGEKVFAAEKVLTSSGAYHLGCFSCCCCCKSLCMKTMYEACREIYCKNCYNNFFGINSYGYSCC